MRKAKARSVAREEDCMWMFLEEVSYRLKSREIWLKEGDKNTIFFLFFFIKWIMHIREGFFFFLPKSKLLGLSHMRTRR